MFYVKTCTKCLKVSWVTRKDISICRCMAPYITETPAERDARLGITKNDITTFVVENELRGTKYEKLKESV